MLFHYSNPPLFIFNIPQAGENISNYGLILHSLKSWCRSIHLWKTDLSKEKARRWTNEQELFNQTAHLDYSALSFVLTKTFKEVIWDCERVCEASLRHQTLGFFCVSEPMMELFCQIISNYGSWGLDSQPRLQLRLRSDKKGTDYVKKVFPTPIESIDRFDVFESCDCISYGQVGFAVFSDWKRIVRCAN